MRERSTIFIVIFIWIFTAIFPAKADKLHFSNGDVVSGNLIRMAANRLTFESTYAGEMTVDWSEVVNLVTDEPITVNLDNGRSVQGIAQRASFKWLIMESDNVETFFGRKIQ